MTANINPATGIAYGFISFDALDPETTDRLQFGGQANEPAYEAALAEAKIAHAERGGDEEFDEDAFNDSWQPDEPEHEGVLDGVKYRTTWLGGAPHVWIFESPFTTDRARRASPCVPNAGILDTLDGDVTAYDVPAGWRFAG